MRQGDYAAAIGHLTAGLQIENSNRALRATLNRATLLLNNPGWFRQEEEQRRRQAAQTSGMTRVEATRSSCATEASALNNGATPGAKSATPSSSKLERFIATALSALPQTLREAAQRFRTMDGPQEVARTYIACLLEANAAQGAELAARNSAASAAAGTAIRLNVYVRSSWGLRFDNSGAPTEDLIDQTRDIIASDPEHLAYMTIHYARSSPPDEWRPQVAVLRRMLLDLGVPANKIRVRAGEWPDLEAGFTPTCANTLIYSAEDRARFRREAGLIGCSD
jgi:hypothetical protein